MINPHTDLKWRSRFSNTHKTKNVDSDIIFQVKKYLRKSYQIPPSQIKIEALKITKKGCIVLGPLSHFEIAMMPDLIRTPDIIVTNANNKPQFMIEQDGHIHQSKKVIKKDKIRNTHYAQAGLPYIILSTATIKSTGMIPVKYLDTKLEKIDVMAISTKRHPYTQTDCTNKDGGCHDD